MRTKTFPPTVSIDPVPLYNLIADAIRGLGGHGSAEWVEDTIDKLSEYQTMLEDMADFAEEEE